MLSNTTKGYILAAIAAASYGTNPLFALPLYKIGMNPESVLFFRYMTAIPMLAAMLMMRGRGFGLRGHQILPLVAMGLIMAISSLTLFESYNHMAAGIASTLLFVYPIMVAVIMALFFKERLTITTILCIVMALSGIGLLYRGSDGDTLSLVGTLLVMASSLSYAIYIVGANRPMLSEIPTLKITFYVLVFGALIFAGRFATGTPFTMPASKVFVASVFNPVNGRFVDVPSGSYFEEAVNWAVANGITTGTSATTFDPDGICTRAQAVTFLWRAAGSPAPANSTTPFTDVAADSYYAQAVAWAVENGITKGTSDTTFSPDAHCSRAQIVTFLWRAQKSPVVTAANPFADVSVDAYYVNAIQWAVSEGVTTGTSAVTFSPDADCTRAQIVTFIWRALGK